MTLFPNFNLGRTIYFLLLVVRDCTPELQAQSARTQSRGDFTLVFWPVKLGTLSPLRGSLHTSTAWHSIWWSRLWLLWQMSATPGNSGAVDGPEVMQYISNFQERPNGHDRKDPRTEN